MTQGSKLRKFRLLCGLTQQQLAFSIDVHQTTIHDWESDHRPINPSYLFKLSHELNISIHDLANEGTIIQIVSPKEIDLNGDLDNNDLPVESLKQAITNMQASISRLNHNIELLMGKI